MSEDVKNNLKLTARNEEDLKVISAYSQDSIVSIRDIVFLKKNRIFIMVTNRFMWEALQKKFERKNIKRIRSALKFEEVLKVRSKKINQKNKNRNLECLAIQCDEKLNNNYEVKIFFSGDGVITLTLEAIDVILQDLGKPWEAKYLPKHKIWRLIYLLILNKTMNKKKGDRIG